MIRRSSRACAGDTSSRSAPDDVEEMGRAERAIVVVERERHDDVRTASATRSDAGSTPTTSNVLPLKAIGAADD